MSVTEASVLERVEGKLDQILATQMEILTWKSEVEEVMNGMQGNPMLSALSKIFSR